MIHRVSLEIRGETLSIETGKLAKQANATVFISLNGTSVLVPVVMSNKSDFNLDYFPLQVQYSEKYYAAGKIPGGFIKREGRPKDKEVLVSRLIDRPLRPLFPEGLRHEVQISPTTLSANQTTPPDILSMIGASAALSISDIPFYGPLGAIRIGMIDGEYIINPTFQELEKSTLDLVVAGTKKAITMIEGGMNELPEDVVLKAIEIAHDSIKDIITIQEELIQLCGKKKRETELFCIEPDIQSKVFEKKEEVRQALHIKHNKTELYSRLEAIGKKLEESLLQAESSLESLHQRRLQVKTAFQELEYQVVREMINEEKQRIDGRTMKELRSIDCEIDLLSRTHGSALFTRGETQSLAVVTLGTTTDVQRLDDLEGEGTKDFLLHYNFPPFSVGETGRYGSPGRREIGHGALAERAILPVLPKHKDFPYTIRVVSEILESNGSSSMATVCSSSMALQSAGVPIRKSVSGVAMGLITLGEKFEILTDIQGLEDHLGDMDFKVAGTRDGLTAIQLDIKIEGITHEIIRKTCEQAKEARLQILDIMGRTIEKPKEFLSLYAPKIISFDISIDKIKDVVGPGGKVIRKIISDTNTSIDIDNNGKVLISSKDERATQLAYERIQDLVMDAEVGKVYQGQVKRITDFGAFIEILPGKEGLCHISCLAKGKVKKVEDVVKENDIVTVKCINIDASGKVRLSIKDL